MPRTKPNQPPSAADPEELSSQAHIAASSSKALHPVGNLFEKDTNSYWQSEGTLPHHIQIDFNHRVLLQLQICFDYLKDESYTPNAITIQAGEYSFYDVLQVKFDEPQGWIVINLTDITDFHQLRAATNYETSDQEKGIEIYALRLLIHSNCANGRDSRIRGIRLLGYPQKSNHPTTNNASSKAKLVAVDKGQSSLLDAEPSYTTVIRV